MSPEDTLKRAFPALLTVPVAAIAYFQGSAVANLVADALLPPRAREAQVRPVHRPTVQSPISAHAILEHNPFDHATDLSPTPPAPSTTPAPSASSTLDVSDPLHAETCQDISVEIVSEATDPTESIAMLQEQKEKSGIARRVGDAIGDYRVEYIGFNQLEHSPAVWLSQGSTLCQAVLFGDEPEKAKGAPNTAHKAAPKPPPKPASGQGALPEKIASKIQKVSEKEFDVDRSVVNEVLENKATLMRGTRMVPRKGKDGKGVGIALFGVRPNTLLGTLGLKNGDTIDKINGFDISDPEKALQAYARLRTADGLQIEITRRGKPETIQLNLK
jgi:general secretion pathway protein C